MKKLLHRILRFLIILFQVKNIPAAYYLSGNGKNYVIKGKKEFEWKNGGFYFKKPSFTVPMADFEEWGGDINQISNFFENDNVTTNEKGDYIIESNVNDRSIKIHLKNFGSLFVVNELFTEQLYDININQKSVVIDVGMNVGLASLYFATYEKVEKIYAFEPFPDTYREALLNFEINDKGLTSKIIHHNAGVGDINKTISVPKPYAGDLGGSTTEYFLKELKKDDVERLKNGYIDVRISSIIDILKDVKDKNQDSKIILKLDCEGAEFEIIEALNNAGLLKEVATYLIEWHFKPKKIITDIFTANNFSYIAPDRTDISESVGMIYAFRN